ncbi:MAG: thermonuclease family protein [Lautropia sp.]|nr:thermonuclease family protein [Lautropia sp.]
MGTGDLRLNQIDAPERGQAFGQAARRKLADLVHGRTVTLETDGTDRYGRTIAQIFLDERNINLEMVGSGYAWAYRKYLKDPRYLQREAEARAASRGLWSQPGAIYPAEYRHGKAAGPVSLEVRPPAPKQTTDTQPPHARVNDAGRLPATQARTRTGRHQVQASPAQVQLQPQVPMQPQAQARTKTRPQPVRLDTFSCQGKRFCREMKSCAEARFYLTQCGVSRLDRDRDGRPCESLCF